MLRAVCLLPAPACCPVDRPASPPPHPPRPRPLQVLGKRKLKWKRIGEHFGMKGKLARKHYALASGKQAPEEEDHE